MTDMNIETSCKVAWEYHSESIPAPMSELEEVLGEAVTPGDSGYAEEEIVGIFRLKDGRFLYVSGGCDTTGWDCQSSASGKIYQTLEALLVSEVTTDDRLRLTNETKRCWNHDDCAVNPELGRACLTGNH